MQKSAFAIFLLFPVLIFAQLRISNLASYQLGNLPYTEPKDYNSFYDQLNINYKYDWLKLFTRFELFQAEDETKNYAKFNQYRLEIKYDKLQVKAGHFYEMFGRGLILRTYEIPENIYEDVGYRVRHGFYRDIFGGYIGFSGKSFAIKAFKGKPLINLLPPTLDNELRREDDLLGLSGSFKAKGLSFSTHYISNKTEFRKESFLSLGTSISLTDNVDLYFEYAHETNQFLDTGADRKFGIYGSTNLYVDRFGLSLEYKSYNNLFLGSGYNDPPTLVKEHPYPILNRRTHVTNLENEIGIQLDTYYRNTNEDLYTFNFSYGVNALYKTFNYYEIFFQWDTEFGTNNRIKVFADYAADELMDEIDRISLGSIYETPIWGNWHLKVDAEIQKFDRIFGQQKDIYNGYLSLSFIPLTLITASVIWETTDDEYLTDNPNTQAIETIPRHWFAFNMAYRMSASNRFELLIGQRRGGPSCTSGICFEVLDFEGVELKWVTRI